MTQAEILREIQQLPFQEQARIHETLTRLIGSQPHSSSKVETKQNALAAAARALRSDYQSDPELTAFTSLDSDDFHATR